VNSAPDIAVDVEGLTKSFDGRKVVRNLSMQVKRGTIYGFLGPNGSGKTTTIRMLTGLLTPDEGRGTCLGYDIRTESDEIKRHVGYMTQRFSLYQDLSSRENLEFVARLYGLAKPTVAARAMIERIGLAGREEQLAGELSGLHLAQPAAAPARRADRGRRSQGAARILERDPRAGGPGAHGAGVHPLHGRGRALS
jgi:ABC-2 type transport system ATP-binding protein